MSTIELPGVGFAAPRCPIPGCRETLSRDWDYEYRCGDCRMSWGTDGQDGHLDDEVERCGAIGETVVGGYEFGLGVVSNTIRRVCYLPAGHDEYGRAHAGYDPDEPGDPWHDWDSEVPA